MVSNNRFFVYNTDNFDDDDDDDDVYGDVYGDVSDYHNRIHNNNHILEQSHLIIDHLRHPRQLI